MSRIAVVTGSNGRIGQATCARFAKTGLTAVGIDVGPTAAGNWPHYQSDLTDLEQMRATFARIESEHGLIRVLFNNAGIYHDGEDFLDASPEGFDQTLDINLRTPFFATQLVAKRLIASGETGAIVNTASLAGQAGSTVVDYGAAKAALINFTRSAARALGPHGIRVNAVAPGLIDTAMGARVPEASRTRMMTHSALRRIGEPEEIANVVNFLAGDEFLLRHRGDDRRQRRVMRPMPPYRSCARWN